MSTPELRGFARFGRPAGPALAPAPTGLPGQSGQSVPSAPPPATGGRGFARFAPANDGGNQAQPVRQLPEDVAPVPAEGGLWFKAGQVVDRFQEGIRARLNPDPEKDPEHYQEWLENQPPSPNETPDQARERLMKSTGPGAAPLAHQTWASKQVIEAAANAVDPDLKRTKQLTRRILDVLGTTNAFSAQYTLNVVKAMKSGDPLEIAKAMTPPVNAYYAGKVAIDQLKGRAEGPTYSDVLREVGVTNPWLLGVGGFILDVGLDPITYAAPFGATKLGRLADIYTGATETVARTGIKLDVALARATEAAPKDLKAIQDIQRAGDTEKLLRGKTLAEKIQRGQKTGLFGYHKPVGFKSKSVAQEVPIHDEVTASLFPGRTAGEHMSYREMMDLERLAPDAAPYVRNPLSPGKRILVGETVRKEGKLIIPKFEASTGTPFPFDIPGARPLETGMRSLDASMAEVGRKAKRFLRGDDETALPILSGIQKGTSSAIQFAEEKFKAYPHFPGVDEGMHDRNVERGRMEASRITADQSVAVDKGREIFQDVPKDQRGRLASATEEGLMVPVAGMSDPYLLRTFKAFDESQMADLRQKVEKIPLMERTLAQAREDVIELAPELENKLLEELDEAKQLRGKFRRSIKDHEKAILAHYNAIEAGEAFVIRKSNGTRTMDDIFEATADRQEGYRKLTGKFFDPPGNPKWDATPPAGAAPPGEGMAPPAAAAPAPPEQVAPEPRRREDRIPAMEERAAQLEIQSEQLHMEAQASIAATEGVMNPAILRQAVEEANAKAEQANALADDLMALQQKIATEKVRAENSAEIDKMIAEAEKTLGKNREERVAGIKARIGDEPAEALKEHREEMKTIGGQIGRSKTEKERAPLFEQGERLRAEKAVDRAKRIAKTPEEEEQLLEQYATSIERTRLRRRQGHKLAQGKAAKPMIERLEREGSGRINFESDEGTAYISLNKSDRAAEEGKWFLSIKSKGGATLTKSRGNVKELVDEALNRGFKVVKPETSAPKPTVPAKSVIDDQAVKDAEEMFGKPEAGASAPPDAGIGITAPPATPVSAYEEARKAYRKGEIGDDEFMAARQAHDRETLRFEASRGEVGMNALPKELSGSKPRYGYKDKNFTLAFNSDVDRAMFITSQEKKSKADAKFRAWLNDLGYTDEQITQGGAATRSRIKALAKNEQGDEIVVDAGHLKAGVEAPKMKVEAPVKPAAAAEIGKPLEGPAGPEITLQAPDDPNSAFRARPRYAAFDDIFPSHTAEGAPVAGFPAEPWRQTRVDRTSPESVQLTRERAAKFNPEEVLGANPYLDHGPPKVDALGRSLQGTGRLGVLELARSDPEKWAAYQKALALEGEARGLGPPPAGMKDPILVEEIMDPADFEAVATSGNRAAAAAQTTTETSIGDALRLSDDVVKKLYVGESQTLDQAINSPQNRRIVDQFLEGVAPGDRGKLIVTGKGLTADGISRLRAALWTKTMGQGDDAIDLARAMFEGGDNQVKTIGNAVLSSLGNLNRVEGLVRDGARSADVSLTRRLSVSMRRLNGMRQRKEDVHEYLNNISFIQDDPFETKLFEFVATTRNQTDIKKMLALYAEEVEKQSDLRNVGLFGDSAPAAGEKVWDDAARRFKQEVQGEELLLDPKASTAERAAAAGGEVAEDLDVARKTASPSGVGEKDVQGKPRKRKQPSTHRPLVARTENRLGVPSTKVVEAARQEKAYRFALDSAVKKKLGAKTRWKFEGEADRLMVQIGDASKFGKHELVTGGKMLGPFANRVDAMNAVAKHLDMDIPTPRYRADGGPSVIFDFLDPLTPAEIRTIVKNGESAVDAILDMNRTNMGLFAPLEAGWNYVEKMLRDHADIRKAVVAETIDDLIWLDPKLLDKREMLIDAFDAMHRVERARGSLAEFIHNYMPHVPKSAAKLEWFRKTPLGKEMLKKESFETPREWDATIRELNSAFRREGGKGDLFETDSMLLLGLRFNKSIRFGNRFKSLQTELTHMGLPLDRLLSDLKAEGRAPEMIDQIMRGRFKASYLMDRLGYTKEQIRMAREIEDRLNSLGLGTSGEVKFGLALDEAVRYGAVQGDTPVEVRRALAEAHMQLTGKTIDAGDDAEAYVKALNRMAVSMKKADLRAAADAIEQELGALKESYKLLAPEFGVFTTRGEFEKVLEEGFNPGFDYSTFINLVKDARSDEGALVAFDWDKFQSITDAVEASKTRAWIMPKDIADDMNRGITAVGGTSKQSREFMSGIFKITNHYKAWTLAIFPQYHARNWMTNLWMNHMYAGLDDWGLYKIADQIKDGKISTWNGYSRDEIVRLMDEHGITNHGFYGSDIQQAFEEAIQRKTESVKDVAGRVVKLDVGKATDPFGTISAGLAFGRRLENNARSALFMDGLQKGLRPYEASLRVKKYLFDYDELSDFERRWMKLFLPFYTWQRKNIPLQVEMMVQRPWAQAMPTKITNALNEIAPAVVEALGQQRGTPLTEQEREILSNSVYGYIEENFPVKLNTVGGRTRYISVGGYFPISDLLSAGDLDKWFGQLAPFYSLPFELSKNLSVWRGKPIESYEGQTEKWLMNTRLTKKQVYTLNRFRFFATLDRIMTMKDGHERDAALARLLAGSATLMGFRPTDIDLIGETDHQLKDLERQENKLWTRKVLEQQKAALGGGTEIGKPVQEKLDDQINRIEALRAWLLKDPNLFRYGSAPR